jgi:hypothetical protein
LLEKAIPNWDRETRRTFRGRRGSMVTGDTERRKLSFCGEATRAI